jgi:hypothetical protein
MSTRTPDPFLDEVAQGAGDDSARNVPEAERHARLVERLNEAELELILKASALRLTSLALAQHSPEVDETA